MTGESIAALLAELTGVGGPGDDITAEQIYAQWQSLSIPEDGEYLEELVRYNLTNLGIGAGTSSAPEYPIKYGAAEGESLLSMLLRNGAGSTAALTSALAAGTSYTALPVSSTTIAIANGQTVTVVSGNTTETFVASAAAPVGSTSISVTSKEASASFDAGSFVYPGSYPNGIPESAEQTLLRTGLIGWS